MCTYPGMPVYSEYITVLILCRDTSCGIYRLRSITSIFFAIDLKSHFIDDLTHTRTYIFIHITNSATSEKSYDRQQQRFLIREHDRAPAG